MLADLWAVSRGRTRPGKLPAAARLPLRRGGRGGQRDVAGKSCPRAQVRRAVTARWMTRQHPTTTPPPSAEAGKRAEARFYASFGRLEQLKARLVLRLARRFLPLRGVGKVSYLQKPGCDPRVRASSRRSTGRRGPARRPRMTPSTSPRMSLALTCRAT